MRRKNPVFVYGQYQLIQKTHLEIYAYTRTLESEQILVLLNFKSNQAEIALPEAKHISQTLIDNYDGVNIQE